MTTSEIVALIVAGPVILGFSLLIWTILIREWRGKN